MYTAMRYSHEDFTKKKKKISLCAFFNLLIGCQEGFFLNVHLEWLVLALMILLSLL